MTVENLPTELSERFDIGESLVDGSTGQIFRATDTTSGKAGVLKIVKSEVFGASSDRQRLKRELAKQATLSHANLALPTVTGETGKVVWLFREWIDGETLAERLEAKGPLILSEALATTAQIAAGLDELHRAGLLCRDLKPSHVVLTKDNRAVIVDPGLAAPVPHDDVFELAGTPAYMSPEQAKGKLVSFRSDLYALGCVVYEIVTGEPPFEAEDVEGLLQAHISDDAPASPNTLPDPIQHLFVELMSKDPRGRPFSANAVRRVLNPYVPEDMRVNDDPDSSERSSTLPGMPSDAPPRPPSLAPPRPPSMQPPPPEPAKAEAQPPEEEANNTQPVQVEDVLEAVDALPPQESRESAPSRTSAPPPTPAAARSSAPPPPPARASAPPVSGAPPKRSSLPPAPPPPDRTSAAPEDAASADAPTEVAPTFGAMAAAAQDAGAPSPDQTQPVRAVDILSDEESGSGEGAQLDGAASVDGLDYDDDADTLARDVPDSLAAMQPAVGSNPPNPAVSATPTAPGIGAPSQPPGHSPSHPPSHPPSQPAGPQGSHPPSGYPSQPPRHSQPVTAQPAPATNNRAGCMMLGASAMILAAAIIGAGMFFLSRKEARDSVAANSPPSDTLSSHAAAPLETPPTPEPAPSLAPPATEKPPAEPTLVAGQEAAGLEAGGPEEAGPEEAGPEEAGPEEAGPGSGEPEGESGSSSQADMEAEPDAPSIASTMDQSSTRSRTSNMRTRPAAMAAAMAGSPFDQAREAARTHFSAGRFREAAAAYQRATSINPRHAGSYAGLGNARLRLQDYRGAVAAFQRAVQLSPRNSGFFTSLGHAYRASGNAAHARQAYQRALALNPTNRAAQQSLQSM